MTRLLPIAGLCFAASALCATSWAPLAVPGATRYLADAGSLHAEHGAARRLTQDPHAARPAPFPPRKARALLRPLAPTRLDATQARGTWERHRRRVAARTNPPWPLRPDPHTPHGSPTHEARQGRGGVPGGSVWGRDAGHSSGLSRRDANRRALTASAHR